MDPYTLIDSHQKKAAAHDAAYVYESIRKNIVIRPLNQASQASLSSLNDQTMNIAAS